MNFVLFTCSLFFLHKIPTIIQLLYFVFLGMPATMRLLAVFTLALYALSSIAVADDEFSSNNTLASIIPPMHSDDLATQEHKQKLVDSLLHISNGNEQFSLEFLKRLSAAVTNVNYGIYTILLITVNSLLISLCSTTREINFAQDINYANFD